MTSLPVEVQITLVLCATVVLLSVWGSVKKALLPEPPPHHPYSWLTQQRLSHYKAFLEALSDVHAGRSARGVWRRLTQSTNAICLQAPPEVVTVVLRCHDAAVKDGRVPEELATELLATMRADLHLPFTDLGRDLRFHIPPGSPHADGTDA